MYPYTTRQIRAINKVWRVARDVTLRYLSIRYYSEENKELEESYYIELLNSALTPEILSRLPTDDNTRANVDKLLSGHFFYCESCLRLMPAWFRVSDEDWKRYIEPDIQDRVICRACYNGIREAKNDAA